MKLDASNTGLQLRALYQVPWLVMASRWRASHSADIGHRARRANKTEDMIVVASAPPHGTFLGSHQSRRPLPCLLVPETPVSAAGSIAQGPWPFPPFSQTFFFCFFTYFFFSFFLMRNYSPGGYFCFIKSRLELWRWCRVHFFVVQVRIYISTSSSSLSETQVFVSYDSSYSLSPTNSLCSCTTFMFVKWRKISSRDIKYLPINTLYLDYRKKKL